MRVLTVTAAGAERLREQMEQVLEPVGEALCELSPAEAELLAALLEEIAERREAAAASTPGPERVFQMDGYSRALLM